jgi:glutaconate CoA-transferase subunit A
MSTIARTLDEALAPITDGCMLAVPRESSGAAMAATRALVRRGVKRLHLITLPTSSLQADLLIGAGCVETLDTSGVSLGEFGAVSPSSAFNLDGVYRMRGGLQHATSCCAAPENMALRGHGQNSGDLPVSCEGPER